jgi:hypothetical protein
LLAFAQVEETTALDGVLYVLEQLIAAMLARVEHAGQRRLLRTLGDLDRATLLLRQACLVVLDSVALGSCPSATPSISHLPNVRS